MKKILVFIGLIILLLVDLSGCQENQTHTDDEEKRADIVSYSVTTIWRDSIYHEEPGFYHDLPDNTIYNSKYVINGVLKNIGNKHIDELVIIAIFYDANNGELYRTNSIDGFIQNISIDSTQDFTFSIDFYDSEYYSDFDHVDFEISIL